MIELIKKELIASQQWTDRLIKDLDDSKWKKAPEGFNTNINWQIGHLTISTYFHTLVCISGSDNEVKTKMSPKQYSSWYGMNSNPLDHLSDKPDSEEMITNLELIDRRGIELLNSLDEKELDEATLMENPVAKTKMEALFWAFKHRMWHSGQIALIKSHLT